MINKNELRHSSIKDTQVYNEGSQNNCYGTDKIGWGVRDPNLLAYIAKTKYQQP